MQVLQASKFYYPKPGGIEQVVKTYAERLNDKHTVRVLASVPQGVGRSETIQGISVTKTSSLGVLSSVPIAPTFPIRLRQMSRDADIIHYHLPNPLCVVSQLIFGPTDGNIVVTYHSDIVSQSTALTFYRPVLHRFLNKADQILVTSLKLIEHSRELQPHKDKCTVVPLSVDLDEYTEYDGPEFDLGADIEDPVFLFVGRLNYYKGVEYLIDAMSGVNATLLVAGHGERRKALESRARERGIQDRVRFLGRVPDEKLHYCYDLADVFVLPSVEPSEAFGIVQLEAMAYETPVINTDLPSGVPWVSKHGETGLTVPPRDAGALMDAMNSLLDDPDRRRELGRKARRRVEEQFNEKQMIERTEAVYESVVRE